METEIVVFYMFNDFVDKFSDTYCHCNFKNTHNINFQSTSCNTVLWRSYWFCFATPESIKNAEKVVQVTDTPLSNSQF
jgi:hypothetical protein